MRILKWMPFFDIKEESPIVPIWVSFPNLRLHFFQPESFTCAGLNIRETSSNRSGYCLSDEAFYGQNSY
ncbi:hypothetical protein MA16_Dca020263 [Dendrobium catenatum]|uniref:DUF4283 domain-containing protein n=1 Tax=Dendrobium catenatum TaxID=906689 RepID=A0A2I0WAY8_9ASPA|nr:hypothetical protein MA16_Dca020263 [Dendrobium catenatum]